MGASPYLGDILLFGGTYAPKGWADCNGQLMQISQFGALFAILGDVYGGDGRTTFALPDLRGRAPVGVNHSPPGLPYSRGQLAGQEQVTMDQQSMPNHFHGAHVSVDLELNASTSTATTTTPTTGSVLAAARDAKKGQAIKIYRQSSTELVGLSGANVDVNVALSSTGSGQPIPNQQPWLATRYIIAIEGDFPPRN